MSGDTPVTVALAHLQTAMDKLKEAVTFIYDHDLSIVAHSDIREALEKLREADVIYTNSQIQDLINKALLTHTTLTIETAHPGWPTHKAWLEEQFAILTQRCEDLQLQIDGEITPETDLQKAIADVYDRYAPILRHLYDSYEEAVAAGSTATAEILQNSINDTLLEQHEEVMQVHKDYMDVNQPNPTEV